MPAPVTRSPEDEIAVIWATAFGAGPGEIAAYLGVSEAVARGIIRRLEATETLMRAALEIAQESKRRGAPTGATGTQESPARSEPASDRPPPDGGR